MKENADWSALFPEIVGCERIIQPIKQDGKVFEQVAVYRRQGAPENENSGYYGCGTIALRFEPSARETAIENFSKPLELPFVQKRKIKTFDAYSSSPQCGNDIWMGSTSVYFDEDKVLTVSANLGAGRILAFAQIADYDLMKSSIDKFIKRKN